MTVKVAVFLAGATLMALEVAAFRIVGRVFGAALRETTTVIAVFMAAMSIGYWAGGRIGDRWPSRRTLAGTIFLAALATAIIPTLDRALSVRIAESSAALSVHALIATLLLFFVPTLFLAAVSPMAIRLTATETTQSGSVAGSISALSTIGSIFGTIASAFFLLDWLKSIDRTVLVLATTMFVTAGLVMFGERTRLIRPLVAASFFVIILLYAGSETIGRSTTISRDRNVLFEADSPYHHVVVRSHAGGTFRILKFDAMSVQTSMIVSDPTGLGNQYISYFHLAKAIHPQARSLLMIGLGGGSAAKQFLRLYPEVTIDAVEIDPMVVDVAKKFFSVSENERFRIHVSDGRQFVKRATRKWDVVFIDSYTANRYGSTIPAHLVTREFFEEAKSKLAPDGVLHFHLYTGNESPFARALERTLHDVFPVVTTFTGGGFTEYFATGTPLSKEEIVQRAKPLPWGSLAEAAETMDGSRHWRDGDPVLTDDYSPVDTLLRAGREGKE